MRPEDQPGGTINFITKRGTSDTPKVTVRTGITAFTENFGKSAAPSGNVQVEGRSGDFDYFASASGNFSRRTYDGHGNEMASDAMLGQGGGDRTGWGDLSGGTAHQRNWKAPPYSWPKRRESSSENSSRLIGVGWTA